MILFVKMMKYGTPFQSWIKKIFFFITLFMLAFLFCSVVSYSPHDLSFFHRATADYAYNNWCDAAGAYCASILLFLFGGIGSLLLILLMIHCCIQWYKGLLKKNKDQGYAWIVLLCSSTALAYTVHYDVITTQIAGGYVGSCLSTLAAHFFDPFLLPIFFAIVLASSIILVSRLAFVQLGIMLLRYAKAHKIHSSTLRAVYVACMWLLLPLKWVMKKIYTLYNDSSITQSAQELILYDLENALAHDHNDNDEKFWQSYVTKEVQKLHKAPEEQYTLHDSLSTIEPAIRHEESEKKKPALSRYKMPSVSWFTTQSEQAADDDGTYKQLATTLEEKLERFGIKGHVSSIKVGPVITLFEYQPDIDSKISKIIALEDDLALALQALSIRIIAPIPGRSVVGFEVSNKQRRSVLLGHVLHSSDFKNFQGHLPLVLGQDSIGSTVIVDLATMPHLLVAGSTGSGKSVALNGMLISLLCKHSPETLRLILIDPKRLEFASYADIPHLLVPIVTEARKAAVVLKWVVKTMETRYALMEEANVRNIFDYHNLLLQEPQRPAMPFIVVMIDELSDLMMTAPKETEDLIARITQMARAAGIHMVVATQRPSVDVITGLIKVNFPSRISFRVTSKIDSRTILDCNGADKLLGKGDMLFLDSSSRLMRAHGAYVSTQEIEKFVAYIRSQQVVEYIDVSQDSFAQVHDDEEVDDQLYHEVLRFIQSIDEVSISLLQRKFRIGYNRSARIIDRLESQGIIMQEPGGKTRKVIR